VSGTRWQHGYFSGTVYATTAIDTAILYATKRVETGSIYLASSSNYSLYVSTTTIVINNTTHSSQLALGSTIFVNLVFRPTGTTKTVDLGQSSSAWDNAYADDHVNVADFYHFDDRDDLAAINAIKGSGRIQAHSGYELIDDNTIPEWLLLRHKKAVIEYDDLDCPDRSFEIGDLVTTKDGRPYLSLKTMISLCMGAIRQLDAKIAKIEELKTLIQV